MPRPKKPMGDSSLDVKEFWKRLFRPPCFGDSIHCPVLFTEKMYACKHYHECDKETLKNFKKVCIIGQ